LGVFEQMRFTYILNCFTCFLKRVPTPYRLIGVERAQ
jgi:hypothetical protein